MLDVATTVQAFLQAFYRGGRALRPRSSVACSLAAALREGRIRQSCSRSPACRHALPAGPWAPPAPATPAAPQYAHLARARLYLAGESAAGHYLPSIAAHLLRAGPAVPLAGLLMGNPCVNAPAM